MQCVCGLFEFLELDILLQLFELLRKEHKFLHNERDVRVFHSCKHVVDVIDFSFDEF